MLGNQEGSSEGLVWYLQVQVALLWNQLNAVISQVAQSNQQLSLQQNLILGLQQQLFHRCLQRDADQNLISKLVGKLLEPESDAGPAERSQEDKWDTESTYAGSPDSPGGSDSDNEDADWIFVRDASEDANDERQRAGDRQEPFVMEGAPPTPAGLWLQLPICQDQVGDQGSNAPDGFAPTTTPLGTAEEPIVMEGAAPTPAGLWLQLPICQDQRGDHSCDVPEGCPVAPTTPLSSARCQETPSDEPPKKRPSLASTAAPDDSDQEIEDEECSCDAFSGSEDAQDAGRESGGIRRAWAKPEDADQHLCMDEGRRSTGSREGRADAACQTDGDDCAVCGSLRETSATPCSHSPTAFTGIEVGGGECTPSDLHVANLLPYLGVQELLNWRLVSRRTRSPEALTAHVAEMGSMDRPDAIVGFADKIQVFVDNPDTSFHEASFGGDVEQQKLYLCRSWCLALASKTRAHFAESYIRDTVGKNLQCLLRHCWRADASDATGAAALHIVYNYASDALPFVRQIIAEGMLALMEDLVTSNIRGNLTELMYCTDTLEQVVRSLSRPQRQKWVSLMVKLLMDPHVTKKEDLVWQLKMLWLVDADPKRTYAEAEQQLLIVAKSDSGDVKNGLLNLLNQC